MTPCSSNSSPWSALKTRIVFSRKPRLLQEIEERGEVRVGPVEPLVVEGHRVRHVLGRRPELSLTHAVDRVEREVEVARVTAVEVLPLVGVQERIVRVGGVEEREELPVAVLFDEAEDLGHLLLQGLLAVPEEIPPLVETERLRDPALHERGGPVARAAERLGDQRVVLGRAGRDAEDLRPVLLVALLLDGELGDVARGQHRGVGRQRVGRLGDAAREPHAALRHGVEQRRRIPGVALERAMVGAHGVERDPDHVHAAPGVGGIPAAGHRRRRDG